MTTSPGKERDSRQTDRQANRQRDRQAVRQVGRQTGRSGNDRKRVNKVKRRGSVRSPQDWEEKEK